MNMVGVQTVLSPLMKKESHYIRQALQSMKVEINDKDEVDLDKLDQKKLADALKDYGKEAPKSSKKGE